MTKIEIEFASDVRFGEMYEELQNIREEHKWSISSINIVGEKEWRNLLGNGYERRNKNGWKRKTYARKCDKCKKLFNEGFVIDDGMACYCSNKCLHLDYTEEEFNELYDDGNGSSYWTEWECEEDFQYFEDGSEIEWKAK